MTDSADKAVSSIQLPIDIDNLEFLPEGESGEFDLSTLPPIGTPVVASHTIDIPVSTEQALQAEASQLGVSVEAVILARLNRNNAA